MAANLGDGADVLALRGPESEAHFDHHDIGVGHFVTPNIDKLNPGTPAKPTKQKDISDSSVANSVVNMHTLPSKCLTCHDAT